MLSHELLESLHTRLSAVEARYLDTEINITSLITLDAPIPFWANYHPDDESWCAEDIEQEFASIYGDTIEANYLHNFECRLRALCMEFRICNDENRSFVFSSSILFVQFSLNRYQLAITLVKTRPCADSLGFYRIFLWQIMLLIQQHCLVDYTPRERKLVVQAPLSRQKDILTRISPNFQQYGLETAMLFKDIKTMTIINLGLQDKISMNVSDIALITAAFPAYDELNDQQKVDKRKAMPDTTTSLKRRAEEKP